MAFNTNNYSGSLVYGDYKKIFSLIESNTVTPDISFSPYSVLEALTLDKVLNSKNKFDYFAAINIASEKPETTRLNTYFNSVLPYFSIKHVCSDETSQIKNTGKKVEELKVPIDYFVDGRLFGIKKRFDSIKNGQPLTQTEGWTFFDSFTYSFLDEGFISNTDDLDKVIESIFYNTLFKYFNVDGYYGFELSKNINNLSYTRKGKTETAKDGQTVYVPGVGEAPNYLDISVDSFQKVKNKISIKSSAVRTNYSSTLLPPKQIEFEDTKEEFLSGILLESYLGNRALLTSLSQETSSKIVENYIYSVAEYFNLVHYVLKNAIIDFEFYKKYSSSENDIFSDYKNNLLIFKNFVNYENDLNAVNLAVYTKELLINLLNLVGDESSVNDICNTFLDFLEENEPQIVGNYNREELFNIFKQLNQGAYDTFKEPTPQKLQPSNDGKVKRFQLVSTISFNDQVVHSNDLILQRVYVYRTNEKPSTYEDILQDEKLYKILDLKLDTTKLIPKTIEDNVTLIDDIKANTKYYYCFLSEREYDVYKEVLKFFKGSRIVRHFSSPTKILELEMISTDNSTYLDYSFYTPEQKEFYNKTKNFLSKIKVSASDLQKTYDPELERFIAPKGSMQLWDNTVKLVDSYDLGKGLTVKLRLSSPKTNKKIDLNLRYFLNDFPNFLDKNEVITIDDLKISFGNKKIKEVYSVLMPEIGLVVSAPKSDYLVAVRYLFEKLKYSISLPKIEISAGVKNPPYQSYISKIKPKVTVYLGNKDKKFISIYTNSIPFDNSFENSKNIFNNQKEYKPLLIKDGGFYDLKNIPNFYDNLENFDNLPTDYLDYLKISINFEDEFKTNFTKDLIYSIKNLIPVKIDLYNNINNINEGSSARFTITTNNVKDGTIFYWELVSDTIDDLDFDYVDYTNGLNSSGRIKASDVMSGIATTTQGTVKVYNNSALLKFGLSNDLRTDGQKTFYINLRSSPTNVLSGGDILATSPSVTVNDTSTKLPEFFYLPNGFTPPNLNEGDTFELIIQSKDVSPQDEYYWEIVGKSGNLNASDFIDGVTAGKLIFSESTSPTKFAFLKTAIKQDLLSEGPENFVVNIRKNPTSSILSTSNIYTINDTSTEQKTFKIVPQQFSVNEGQNFSCFVYTSNVPIGTTLYWDLSGTNITSGDFAQINGTFNIKSGDLVSGFGGFNTTATNDLITEGTETFIVNVRETANGPIVATAGPITLNDTSLTPTLSANALILKSKLANLGITLNNDLTADIKSQELGSGVWGGGFKYDAVKGTFVSTPYYTADSDFRLAVLHAGLVSSANTTIKVKFTDLGDKAFFYGSEKSYYDTVQNITKKITTSSWGSAYAAFSISLA